MPSVAALGLKPIDEIDHIVGPPADTGSGAASGDGANLADHQLEYRNCFIEQREQPLFQCSVSDEIKDESLAALPATMAQTRRATRSLAFDERRRLSDLVGGHKRWHVN
jgi:hypothetical protein